MTPLLALAGLLLGVMALLVTPREEEPQIDVTMADVIVPFPGGSARDVEQQVASPLEQRLAQIEGVKHVYSVSRPGSALLTVEFHVGVPRETALVRLYNQVWSNLDLLRTEAGIGQPVVRPRGIDDVPVMSVTLWTDDLQRGPVELAQVARTLEVELQRIPGARDVYTIGAPQRRVVVTLDAAKLASHGLTVRDLVDALRAANMVQELGERVSTAGTVQSAAGAFLASAADVAGLVIGLHGDRPLLLGDVADVRAGADLPESYVWHGAPVGRAGPAAGVAPAVTIAIAKKPGSNAADITAAAAARLAQLEGELIPAGVHLEITRDYGQTATDKAATLIHKLVFATLSVVLLVLFTLGWREAVVVALAVVLTLALTLFASRVMGFTLNRVSLFALIFSIGILVDDAIVVVENIHRHLGRGRRLLEAIPAAVDEVGGPTILATFTVIAALLPMAFVSGLMGPYMRPIPLNASAGMLLSLAVALVVTPWFSARLLARHASAQGAGQGDAAASTALLRLFTRLLSPFLAGRRAPLRRRMLIAAMTVLVLLSAGLVALRVVVLKMLPFDNKSELQVVVDLPEGAPLETTNALLMDAAAVVAQVPEVLNFQGYAGTSAPVNFNGLVRQYYLRAGSTVGDLQVNLVDRRQRERQSHEIARELRIALEPVARRYSASLKVVEVPPGPPVLAPVVAEIYGPDQARVREVALTMERMFRDTPGIVDVDTSVEADTPRERLVVDRVRAARLGVAVPDIIQALAASVAGLDATWIQDGRSRYPQPVRLRLGAGEQAQLQSLLALRVRAADGALVPLSALVTIERGGRDGAIHHKDLRPVVYVTGDEAGGYDSPLYGMFALVGRVASEQIGGLRLAQHFVGQPVDTAGYAVKWDGEWQVTYETFRDMGIAYAAGILLIYFLVVVQFRSYLVPLVIMAPIPLTVIGVMPGHALLGAQFTATSMIGMIALAGIIVRNSILLVDFVNHAMQAGRDVTTALIEACAVRARPIVLTAAAAMLGALFILDDPIFNGLAVALLSGILVSSVLTLLVVPLLYLPLALRRQRAAA
jgi:multidrug efflux pump subunit AcrB